MIHQRKNLWQQLKTELFSVLVGTMSPFQVIFLDEKWLWLEINSMYLSKGSLEMLLNITMSCGLYAK